MVEDFHRIDNNVSPVFIEVQRICSHYSYLLQNLSVGIQRGNASCFLFVCLFVCLFEQCLCFSVVSYLMCTITDYNNTIKNPYQKTGFECPEISYRRTEDVISGHNLCITSLLSCPSFSES